MINMLISILFSSILICCASPVKEITGYVQVEQKITKKQNHEQLRVVYQKLTISYGKAHELEYFDAFPNSFGSFVEIFGNLSEDSKGFKPAPLYDESHLYVQAFFKLSSIDRSVYFNKIINVCVGGNWDSDAISHFQHEMKIMINQSFESFNHSLSKRSDNEIKSFWHFYFDGPHPPENLPKELEQIKELNEQVYFLMMSALKEVQEDWGEHGH